LIWSCYQHAVTTTPSGTPFPRILPVPHLNSLPSSAFPPSLDSLHLCIVISTPFKLDSLLALPVGSIVCPMSCCIIPLMIKTLLMLKSMSVHSLLQATVTHAHRGVFFLFFVFFYLTDLRIIVTRYWQTLDCMHMMLKSLTGSEEVFFFFFLFFSSAPNTKCQVCDVHLYLWTGFISRYNCVLKMCLWLSFI